MEIGTTDRRLEKGKRVVNATVDKGARGGLSDKVAEI